jgi:parallel beta-helix repeat protein
VEVRFNPCTSLNIGNTGPWAALTVNGTETNPVLFTSAGGPGGWDCIRYGWYAVDSLCYMSHAIIENGGAIEGMVSVNDAFPSFTNCTFRNMLGPAIWSLNENSAAWFNNCSFENGNTYPILCYAEQLDHIGSGNTFTNNAIQAVSVLGGGNVTRSQTWNAQPVPYEVTSTIYICASATPIIHISSGTILEFDQSTGLQVGNTVYSSFRGGIIADSVTFRSSRNIPGDWDGIVFNIYVVSESCVLTNCTIEEGGCNGHACVHFNTGSEATLEGCTLRNSSSYGVWGNDVCTPHISNCIFENNPYPISLMAERVHGPGGGNAYLNNTDNRVQVRAGTVQTSQTWNAQSVPYHITGNITITRNGGDPHLGIQYGTELEFAEGSYIEIGNGSYFYWLGSISASGVQFRGDSSAAGFWRGFRFPPYGSTSVLSGCTIRDAGSTGTFIYINQAVPIITGCHILNGQGTGIYLENGTRPQISGCTVSGCTGNPLSVYMDDVGAVLPENNFAGNGGDVVSVRAGTATSSATWQNPGVPFALTGACYIEGTSSPRVEMRPGCIVELPNNAYLQVGHDGYPWTNGSLYAEGVTFTSLNPVDRHAGIYFGEYAVDALCQLRDCIIEYGGNTATQSNIRCNSSSPTLDGCTIRNSSQYGLIINNDTRPVVTNCHFENNASYPISIYANDVMTLGTGNIIPAILQTTSWLLVSR